MPWLRGFSNGAAMAASLFLADLSAYAGLIMIGGCFATEDLPAGAYSGRKVLYCRGSHDLVIPPAKFERAEMYLLRESGADVDIVWYDGGHDITHELTQSIATWFGRQQ